MPVIDDVCIIAFCFSTPLIRMQRCSPSITIATPFGFKKSVGGIQIKTEFNYTDWDDITLTNIGTDAGAEKITASPENWAFKFGIGYNF